MFSLNLKFKFAAGVIYRAIIRSIKFGLVLLFLVSPVQATESLLKEAREALAKNNYKSARSLFEQLKTKEEYQLESLYSLAKANFYIGELDSAEDYIEQVLEFSPNQAEYLFIAARIAGKQAQSASIFTKLGYAKDARKYFAKALELEPTHKPSLIGMIRFHQQAPVMAGGDKAMIPKFLERLRDLDRREAFNIEAPQLLGTNKIKDTLELFESALKSESSIEIGAFRFDFAMTLSNHGYFSEALEQLVKIDLEVYQTKPEFYHMSFYQIAKTSAESQKRLKLGLASINKYASFSNAEKTIPRDWTKFRTAQLTYLIHRNDENKLAIESVRNDTSDNDLKDRIREFLKNNPIKESS